SLSIVHLPYTLVFHSQSLHDALPISGGAALRRPVDADDPGAGDDLHHRADDHPGWHRLRHLERWLDGHHQGQELDRAVRAHHPEDRKSTRLNSSHVKISYAVFCLIKK